MALTLSTHLWVPVFGENVSIMGGREGKKERGKQSTLSGPANLPGTLHMILTKLLYINHNSYCLTISSHYYF